MPRSCRWLLWLLLGVLAGEAGAQSDSAPPLAFRRVHVPPGQIESLLQQEKDTLHPVPPQQFERLLSVVQNASVLGEESVGTRITRCEHTVEYMPPETLRGTTRLRIHHPGEHPVLLPLLPWKVALLEAHWVDAGQESRPAVLGTGPQGHVLLLVRRSGQVELRWQLRAAKHTSRQSRFLLHLPLVPEQSFRVLAPTGTRLRVLPPSLLEPLPRPASGETSSARTGWHIRPAPVSPLEFQFHQPRTGPVAAAGFRQHNLVQLAPQGLQMVSTIVFQGAVPKGPLRFRVPPQLKVLQVELADETVAFRQSSQGVIELAGEKLPEPGQVVRIRAAGPWELEQQRPLPRIRPLGAMWQSEQTRLELLPPLVLKHWQLADCRQTSPWNGQSATIQHFGPGSAIQLVVGPARPQWRIDQITAVEISPGSQVARVGFRVRPVRGELFHLEAMLEPGWTLDRITTEPADLLRSWHLEPVAQGRRRLHLELGKSLSAGQEGLFRLELHQRVIHRRRSIPLAQLWPVSLPQGTFPVRRWLCFPWNEGPPPQVHSPVLQRPLQQEESQVARSLLPGLPEQALLWRLPPGELSGQVVLSPGKTQFQAIIRQQVRLQERRWSCQAELQIRPQHGEVERVELVVVPGARLPEVSWTLGEEPPRLEQSADPVAEPARRFSLVFPRPIRTEATVQLRWQGTWNPPGWQHVPLVGVANAETTHGEISVLAQHWLLLAWKTSSLLPTAASPAAASSPWQSLAAWNYDPQRLAEQPELFLLALHEEDNPALLRPVVWQLHVDTYWDAHSRLLEHRCGLLLDYPLSGRLEFSIPQGLEVTALSIQGRPQQWHLERGRLHVQVPQTLLKHQVLLLEFWLRGRWQPEGFWGSLSPPRLETEYPILAGRWHLWSGHQLQLPGPRKASLWQRWFGPLAGEGSLAGSPARLSFPAEAPGASPARRLEQARRLLAAQLHVAAEAPPDWGSLLLRTGRLLAQRGVPLLLDRVGLAQAGLTPRTPLPSSSGASAVSFDDLQRRFRLKLVPAGRAVLLTTWEADAPLLRADSSPEEENGPGLAFPAHWVSPAQWLWRSQAPESARPLGSGAPWSQTAPWQRVAAVEFSPQGELPHLSLAWTPWWQISGYLAALAVAAAVVWGGRRHRRSTAGAVALALWIAAVAPAPWLDVTQRAVWGVWIGLATLGFVSYNRNRGEPEAPSSCSRVAAAVGAGLLLALAGAESWHALAQDPAPEGKVYPVYIPQEEKPEYYFVPEGFYRFLVEQADRLSRKPHGWLLQRASYRVMLPEEGEQTAQVLAFYYVQVFGTRKPIELDFSRLSEDLRPESVSVNGMAVPARWSRQGKLLVQVPEAGSYELELSFRPPVQSNTDGSALRLPVPPAISARLEVLAGEEPVALEVEPCLGSVQDQARGELWRGELGPVAQLGLRWQPYRQERPLRLEADQLLWLRVHPGSVVLEAQLHCRPLDAPLKQVEVWVDASLQLIPPESPLLRQFRWVQPGSDTAFDDVPAPGVRLLQLQFQEPVAGPVKIPLVFVVKDASGIGRWTIPLVQLRHTESLQHWIALSVDRTLEYREQGQEGLEPLEAEAFLAHWSQAEDPPAVSYDCGNRYPVRYALATFPRVQGPQVEAFHRWELYPGYAELIFQARLQQQPPALSYRLSVPPQIRVQDVEVQVQQRWKPVRWGRWQQQLVFWLPEALPQFRIRLRGWTRLPPQGNWSVPALELLSATSTRHQVRLYHHGALSLAAPNAPPQQPPPLEEHSNLFPAVQWTLVPGEPWPRVQLQPNRPRVTGQLDYTILPGQEGEPWRIDYQLNLHVQQGAVSRVAFRARHLNREEVRLLSPGRLEHWTFPGQDDQLVYFPPRPLQSRAQIRLEISWRPHPERDNPVLQLVPLEIQPLQTYLLVPETGSDSAWQWRPRKLTPLALQGRPLAPVPRPRAMRALGPQWQLVLQPRQAAKRPLRILLVHHRLALGQSDRLLQDSRFLLAASGEADCRFRLPPRARIVTIRLGNRPATWRRAKDGTVRVLLPVSPLPQLLRVVAQLPSPELSRNGHGGSWTPEVVEPQGLVPEQVLWSFAIPWKYRGNLLGASVVPAAFPPRLWCQVLADQIDQAPVLQRLVLQQWWDQASQVLQLFPLPPELEQLPGDDPAWRKTWLALQQLQRSLQARRIEWLPPAPTPLQAQPRLLLHAQGAAPRLVLRSRTSSSLAGIPWWMWAVAPLGMALAAWGAPFLGVLRRRWPGWLLVLAGLVWLVGLHPEAVAVALIAAGLAIAWRSPS